MDERSVGRENKEKRDRKKGEMGREKKKEKRRKRWLSLSLHLEHECGETEAGSSCSQVPEYL